MARNAQVAVRLGAPGIDLNFGCPAKTVNKSEGGAALLRTPDRIGAVCQAVRSAVPAHIPVTAKVRLGFEDDSDFERIALTALDTGISELVVHARTRRQGYRPPAHWHRLADIAASAPVPVIANGELWSPAEVRQCQSVSGCRDFMLARGALCRPDLALATRAEFAGQSHEPLRWPDIVPLLLEFLHRNGSTYEPKYASNPLKQWLVYLKHYFPQAAQLFETVKRIKHFEDMDAALRQVNPPVPAAA